MAASAKLFNQYIWLVEVIFSAGKITRQELDSRWSRSSLNETKESRIPDRTFHRWRQEAEELFNINIDCSKGQPSYYYIANSDDLAQQRRFKWLLSTFAVTNLVSANEHLKDNILLEDMPSGVRFLSSIMDALSNRRKIHVKYSTQFSKDGTHEFEISPYCIKNFKRRWYVIGASSVHEEEIRSYSLDRILELQVLDQTYIIPKDFNGQDYFKDYYGIWRGGISPETVKIRVSSNTANYLRSLPLHHSQNELECNETYSVFTYNIAPTIDFIQELRTCGEELLVLEPKWLAQKFYDLGKAYVKAYKDIL